MLKRRTSRAESGQALLIAVLLLIMLAILAAVFVAFVSHAIAQSGRRVDIEAAERMSVSGVEYAHQELQTSPDMANWRPQLPPPPLPASYYTDWELSRISSRADWTFPPFVKVDNPWESGDSPYSLGSAGQQQRGRCLIQVRYMPSFWVPPAPAAAFTWGTEYYPNDAGLPSATLDMYQYDPLSPFIRITAIGSAANSPNILRVKVAFVPVVLPDRLLNVVDSEETQRWASLGVPTWVDIDGNSQILPDPANPGALLPGEEREFPIWRTDGGVHSNPSVVLYGRTSLGWLQGYRGDAISSAGSIAFNDPSPGFPGPLPTGPYWPGVRFQRDDAVGLVPPASDLDWTNPAQIQVWPSLLPIGGPAPTVVYPPGPGVGTFDPAGGYIQDAQSLWNPAVDAGILANWGNIVNRPNYARRDAQRIRPGLLDAKDQYGAVRLERFARESGIAFEVPPPGGGPRVTKPGWYNTAVFALGNTIYIDNAEDIQAHDPQALHDNWIRAGAQADAFWYGPTYEPPGIEVTFHEKDIASQWDQVNPTDPAGPPPQRAYGNLPNLPDIVITRRPSPNGAQRGFMVPVIGYNGASLLADDPALIWTPASAQPIVDVLPLDIDPKDGLPDNHMVLDYPTDGCLYFTGNVRLRGRLPVSRTDVLDASGLPRRFDLTVVSKECIYVDGNLMTALDWRSGAGSGTPQDIVQDRYAARIALMAQRDVAVNATRGEYQGPGIATDCEFAPDNPEASTSRGHWILEPGKSFITFFGFGGIDLSHPAWEHGRSALNPAVAVPAPADDPLGTAGSGPRYGHPDLSGRPADDIFLKLRVKGSRFTPFHVLINGTPYDFDTRVAAGFPQAADINPCRQMAGNGDVEVLYIPLIVNGAPITQAGGVTGEWGGSALPLAPADPRSIGIDTSPGELNSVDLRPATGMTRPLEIYGVSIERRNGTILGSTGDPATPGGVPIVSPTVDHPYFGWTPATGPPPLVRGGGNVLHSRVMTVSAMCYAQHGSFFVIAGDYFDPLAARVDRNGDGQIVDSPLGANIGGVWYPSDTDYSYSRSGTVDWAEDRRHNLQVQIFGAITENLPPDITCVNDSTDKLCFPVPDLGGQGLSNYLAWSPPMWIYDEGVRATNPLDPPGPVAGWPWAWGPTGLAPRWDMWPAYSRFPRLPASPDLVYFGDLA